MKKIAVFTGTRAEYGLLYWILKGFEKSKDIELQLIVGGMHLSHEFGYTVKTIEQDGFKISERLDFLLSSDSPVGISKSLGLAIISSSDSFSRLQPDLVVILGDRFESMAIAQAAMIASIPIAHIHGGELTQALIDESIRHSITKMSQLHFTSTEVYRRRVIQMGEQPNRVFNVGAPGLDNIKRLKLLTINELSDSLSFPLEKPFFVVTYHPVTLIKGGAIHVLENLLEALDMFSDYNVIITFPNADTYGRNLITILEEYSQKQPDRVLLIESMGQVRYLSALQHSAAVIGNSSSGIIEAPSFHVPTVNIGDRQKGREISDTVINCEESVNEIEFSINKALSKNFKERLKYYNNPYENNNSSDQIVNIISEYDLNSLVQKEFYDFKTE